MKFKAIVASTNVDRVKDRFTEETLKENAASMRDIPVLMGFDQDQLVGIVHSAEFRDGYLSVQGSITDEIINSLYCVPAFIPIKGEYEDETFILQEVNIISFGLTPTPCDTTLTPIEIVE